MVGIPGREFQGFSPERKREEGRGGEGRRRGGGRGEERCMGDKCHSKHLIDYLDWSVIYLRNSSSSCNRTTLFLKSIYREQWLPSLVTVKGLTFVLATN